MCCDNLEVTGVQLRSKDTGSIEVVHVNKQCDKENVDPDTLHKVLYTKERYSISNEAYHELIMSSVCWTVLFLDHGSLKQR